MAHIRARYIRSADFEGELTIEDYVVFTSAPRLKHVSDFWEATMAQALMLDLAQSEALDRLGKTDPGDDGEAAFESDHRKQILQLGNECLLKANIFSLLAAFLEFAVLEVYILVFGGPPNRDRPDFARDIVKPLQEAGVIGELPAAYREYVLANRNAVRNAFSHGRWMDLPTATAGLDLHMTFLGTISYIGSVEDNLRRLGHIIEP